MCLCSWNVTQNPNYKMNTYFKANSDDSFCNIPDRAKPPHNSSFTALCCNRIWDPTFLGSYLTHLVKKDSISWTLVTVLGTQVKVRRLHGLLAVLTTSGRMNTKTAARDRRTAHSKNDHQMSHPICYLFKMTDILRSTGEGPCFPVLILKRSISRSEAMWLVQVVHKRQYKVGMVGHTSSTQEAKAGVLEIHGQSGLHSKTLSQNNKSNTVYTCYSKDI